MPPMAEAIRVAEASPPAAEAERPNSCRIGWRARAYSMMSMPSSIQPRKAATRARHAAGSTALERIAGAMPRAAPFVSPLTNRHSRREARRGFDRFSVQAQQAARLVEGDRLEPDAAAGPELRDGGEIRRGDRGDDRIAAGRLMIDE